MTGTEGLIICSIVFFSVMIFGVILVFTVAFLEAAGEFWKTIKSDVYENLGDKFRGKGITSKKIQRLMERGKLRLVAERHNNKLSIYLQDKKTGDLIYLDYLNIKELMKDE